MARLKVIIRKKALRRIDEVAEWYDENLTRAAATKFAANIYRTIYLLASNPNIGIKDERISLGGRTYYSIMSHKKFRIVYRFTKTNLYIVAIYCNLMDKGGIA